MLGGASDRGWATSGLTRTGNVGLDGEFNAAGWRALRVCDETQLSPDDTRWARGPPADRKTIAVFFVSRQFRFSPRAPTRQVFGFGGTGRRDRGQRREGTAGRADGGRQRWTGGRVRLSRSGPAKLASRAVGTFGAAEVVRLSLPWSLEITARRAACSKTVG
jgi:hypothetical protein